jgi:hypothetical protein
MPKQHVFISYAREDRSFAQEIVRRLKQSDVTIWRDIEDLRGGDHWQQHIDDALTRAEALIVVMSPSATQSQYVTYEWSFALGAGKRVIPVLYRPTELHPRLAQIQYVNFDVINGRRPWARLWDALSSRSQSLARTSTPVLRARFDMTNDKASKVKGGEYVIWLWVENAPKSATSVVYEIQDDTFREPK